MFPFCIDKEAIIVSFATANRISVGGDTATAIYSGKDIKKRY